MESWITQTIGRDTCSYLPISNNNPGSNRKDLCFWASVQWESLRQFADLALKYSQHPYTVSYYSLMLQMWNKDSESSSNFSGVTHIDRKTRIWLYILCFHSTLLSMWKEKVSGLNCTMGTEACLLVGFVPSLFFSVVFQCVCTEGRADSLHPCMTKLSQDRDGNEF
jgi:hypothetical protein